jgi:hypothetical protein
VTVAASSATVPAGPLGAVDRWLARPRPRGVPTLLWALLNLVVLAVTAVVALAVVAVPPLSLLPSEFPLQPEDHFLGPILALLTWPLHLAVVAAVSRTRRARLWTVLTVPLLALPLLLLPFLLALADATNRSVVLAYLLYGAFCRLHPRRFAVPDRPADAT